MTVTRDDLVELALEVTDMTQSRFSLLLETLKDDAAMNRLMKEEWNAKSRDSEEAIREYYRESDVWFANTWSHGIGALLKMADAPWPASLAPWHKVFVGNFIIQERILDYGGGFLNDSHPLVMSGYKVAVAEVSGPVTEFLKRYALMADLADLIEVVGVDSDQPLSAMYDGVVCFETLEHLLHPVEFTRHLYEHINPEKPFAFSASFGAPEHAPYHVASNVRYSDINVWREKLKEIGFLPHWSTNEDHLQIWRRP